MDPRERFESYTEAILSALNGRQAEMYTALPGIIQSYNAERQTCEVQPAIQARVKSQLTGDYEWVNLPVLLDCPVYFPAGGGFTLTFPIIPKDECLVVFSSRCIDAWWDRGAGADGNTPQPQGFIRMHSLSDGFAFVGVRSRPRFLAAASTDSVQLRSDDGGTFVEIKGHDINLVSSTKVHVTAPESIVDSPVTTVNASASATINAGAATITAAGAASISAATASVEASGAVTIKGASIVLKGAGTALKKLVTSTFLDLFNNHTHNYGYVAPETGGTSVGATTGAPTGTPAGASSLSQVVEGE